jgi:CO dehydrogenase/acetyl-CoA synthase alpha subunit
MDRIEDIRNVFCKWCPNDCPDLLGVGETVDCTAENLISEIAQLYDAECEQKIKEIFNERD